MWGGRKDAGMEMGWWEGKTRVREGREARPERRRTGLGEGEHREPRTWKMVLEAGRVIMTGLWRGWHQDCQGQPGTQRQRVGGKKSRFRR